MDTLHWLLLILGLCCLGAAITVGVGLAVGRRRRACKPPTFTPIGEWYDGIPAAYVPTEPLYGQRRLR